MQPFHIEKPPENHKFHSAEAVQMLLLRLPYPDIRCPGWVVVDGNTEDVWDDGQFVRKIVNQVATFSE